MTWTVEKHEDGTFTIKDDHGETVGRYREADVLLAHHAVALQEIWDLREKLDHIRKLIDAI